MFYDVVCYSFKWKSLLIIISPSQRIHWLHDHKFHYFYLPADDMTTPTAKEGLQAAGINSILPKEQSANYVVLPILKTYVEKENVSLIVSYFNKGY